MYFWVQSTDRPSRRHSDSYAFSVSSVHSSQSSMKLRRDTGTCFFGSGFSGGAKSGSYGIDGSHRTPYVSCTRRSVGSPLSSKPIG